MSSITSSISPRVTDNSVVLPFVLISNTSPLSSSSLSGIESPSLSVCHVANSDSDSARTSSMSKSVEVVDHELDVDVEVVEVVVEEVEVNASVGS